MLFILPLKAESIGADVVYNELNPYSSKIISACTLRTAVGLNIASVNNNSRSFASNYYYSDTNNISYTNKRNIYLVTIERTE